MVSCFNTSNRHAIAIAAPGAIAPQSLRTVTRRLLFSFLSFFFFAVRPLYSGHAQYAKREPYQTQYNTYERLSRPCSNYPRSQSTCSTWCQPLRVQHLSPQTWPALLLSMYCPNCPNWLVIGCDRFSALGTSMRQTELPSHTLSRSVFTAHTFGVIQGITHADTDDLGCPLPQEKKMETGNICHV